MARTQGTTARTQRLIALAATTLLGVVTAMAIGRVFLGPASSQRLMLAAAISAVLACALERKNLLLATSVSAAALLVVLGLLVFRSTTWYGLPTIDTLRAIGEAARVVGQEARFQVAPSQPLPPLMLAALTAVWAAVFSSHALAFRAGSPLLALLPPIALVAFADTVLEEFVKPVYGVLFLAAALLVIFADGLRRVQGWGPLWTGPGREARLSVSTGRSARGVAFATVALALIAPLLVPGFGSRAILDFSTHDGDRVHIDPLVSVANNLQRDDPVDLFTVETQSPSYYRYTVLTDFNGAEWLPGSGADPVALPANPAETEPQLDPSHLSSTEAPSVQQHFHYVSTLDQHEVPVGATPVALELGQPAMWDAESGTVTIGGSLDEGTQYTATSLQIAPTPEELRTASSSASMPTPAQMPQYFDLPDNLDPKIQAIADNIVEKAGSPDDAYDKAIAIQNFLTSGGFVYDGTVAKRDDSTALLDFLTTNPRGMCQQFATAMAAMLRMEGVPTRVAVGFTSGISSATDPNLWTVSTDDAHAWPEVLIPGYGWLAFEPTPHKINPIADEYLTQTPGTPQCDKPGGCHGPRHDGQHPPTETTGTRGADINLHDTEGGLAPIPVPEGAAAAASRPITGRRILLAALGLVLLFLLLLPAFRAVRRQRRLRKASGEPRRLILATYDVFTERAAELGYARGTGETPEEFRARVQASGLLHDGDLDRLTRLAVGAAYAAPDPGPDEARSASAAAATTLKDLRRGTPWGQRLRGLYVRER